MSAAAILFATVATADATPTAGLRCGNSTLLGRLLDQLHQLDVDRAWVITRPEWENDIKTAVAAASVDVDVRTSANTGEDLLVLAEIASATQQLLVVGSGDVLTHQEALAGLLADPRVVSGILTGAATGDSWAFRTRAERGRLVSAGSAYHTVRKPGGYFLSLLKIDPRDRDTLVDTASRMARLAEPPLPREWEQEFELKREQWRLEGESEQQLAQRADVVRSDPLPLLLVGLIRSQVHLANSYLRELFWARPLSPEAVDSAVQRMAGYDEDNVLLNSAVKGSDGFFTTFFVSPYSKFIARWAARRGWTPNGVTILSMALGIATAILFATGSRWGLISGAVMLQLAFTLDCVDGQLARYTRQFSQFGAWLDSVFDRGKEYLAYAGLAVGAAVGFDLDVWALAAAALGLQTLRHTIDFSYAASRQQALAGLPALPFEQPRDHPVTVSASTEHVADEGGEQAVEDFDAEADTTEDTGAAVGGSPLARLGHGAVRLSRTLERRSWTRWVKKIIVLPIGERFALISVTAAVWNPQVTFVALLAWGGFALLYQLGGRIMRSMV